ncbi:MAG: ATP:cob(I)alamin adenosyltransferase, partial [Candidatus Limnocylindrales bacterium]
LARAVTRRAERRVISLDREDLVPGAWLVPWLNRLADLLWVYARLVEQSGLGATVTVRT